MASMNKTIITSIALLLMGSAGFSQNCVMALKDGGKMTIVLKSWVNPLLYDPKFLKAKEDKKDEQIAGTSNTCQ
jgi:hypothetical protein